jgi:DNA-binding MarR family transcriptional regulator
MPSNSQALLRAILSMTARLAIPPPELLQIVAPPKGGGGEAQLAAYNMCDGTKGQGEIAKELKIDPGSFSRTVARWIEAGVVIRLGEHPNTKLLHIYPLTKEHAREGR